MRVLIADANLACCELARRVVEEHGGMARLAHDGPRALDLLATTGFDVLITEINLPQVDGFTLAQRALAAAPRLKIIVISGSLGVAETVRAMKLGVSHCLSKPCRAQDLIDVLNKLAGEAGPRTPPGDDQDEMVAVSPLMRRTCSLLSSIARSRATTVLITGETGTGKEIVARKLHALSERQHKPFVAVNCSAIPLSLLESELFGHERGAFTDARLTRKGQFESAGEGTVFLDEIGDLAPESQGKLLRVLQERCFRRVGGNQELALQARVVAATNVDLAAAVRHGRFREDLYYRLAVFPIHLHPLRERKVAILPLAERFIRTFAHELHCEEPQLTAEHRRLLEAHPWPGNVRELRNVIERFVLLGGHLEFPPPVLKPDREHDPRYGVPSPTPYPFPAGAGENNGLPATATGVLAANGGQLDTSERRMIYDLLMRKLLADDSLRNPAPLPADKQAVNV